MQLVKLKFLNTDGAFNSMKREASCSQGWLRLLVQTIFFMITVVTFTIILFISIKPSNVAPRSTCHVFFCQVECLETPFYDDRLHHIYDALKETEKRNCDFIILTIRQPYFTNGILPSKWMGDIRIKVTRLHIIGGNLHYITPGAFGTTIGQSMDALQLTNLTFSCLENGTFNGLNNLVLMHLNECKIENVQTEILKPVRHTLTYITINNSRNWAPIEFTGSVDMPKLKAVSFYRNNFSDNIIRRNTFSKIPECEYLYLNWCNIEAIEYKAFDNLHKIKSLDLTYNSIVTIPEGLFDKIISQASLQTKVFLAHNLWFCDCEMKDFQRLANEGLLADVPVCDKPEKANNITLSDYKEHICKHCSDIKTEAAVGNDSSVAVVNFDSSVRYNNITDIIKKTSPNSRRKYNQEYNCHFKNILINYPTDIEDFNLQFKNKWIYPRLRIESSNMTVVQMDIALSGHNGILWFEHVCPHKIYCIDVTTNNIRLFDVSPKSMYVFCQWNLWTGIIDFKNCVSFNLTEASSQKNNIPDRVYKYILIYLIMSITGLVFGGGFVYVLLWCNPKLLKGSRRLLFVKHKEMDALVLPAKVPLRATKSNIPFPSYDQDIFVVPTDKGEFSRSKSRSVRSNSSSAPSYVSALQPTDDQLEQWRSQQKADDESIYASIGSEFSNISKILRRDSVSYFKLDEDITYSNNL